MKLRRRPQRFSLPSTTASSVARWLRRGSLARRTQHLVVLIALVAMAGGCASASGQYGRGEKWTKAYGETSCHDWRQNMTEDQKLTMAADLLIGKRERNGGPSGLPPDDLVAEFRDSICVGAGEDDSVTTIASLVYFADQAHFNE
jgi:hypothetical protein